MKKKMSLIKDAVGLSFVGVAMLICLIGLLCILLFGAACEYVHDL